MALVDAMAVILTVTFMVTRTTANDHSAAGGQQELEQWIHCVDIEIRGGHHHHAINVIISRHKSIQKEREKERASGQSE